MTLLIRNIQIPEPGSIATGAALNNYLAITILSIVDFIGAFLILGMFWLFYYQMFHRMKTYDFRFLYIHLLSLMIVVFVPFTQSFASRSEIVPAANIPFQLNYLVLSILLIVAWYHAQSRPELLEPELTRAEASFLTKKFLVPFGVAVIGICMAVTGLPYIDLLYILPLIILGIFFRSPP
jgi:uncharacterized membrane protein